MRYISIDHEILTYEGWKWARDITTIDKLFTITGEYISPNGIELVPKNVHPLIFIENNKVNVFGTPDLMICIPGDIMSDDFISLLDIHMYSKTHHNHNNSNIHIYDDDTIVIHQMNDFNEANKKMIDYIVTENKYVSLKKDMSKVDYHYRLLLTVYKQYYTRECILHSDTIFLHKTRGTSIIRFDMSNEPICVKRNGCICWIIQ